LNWSFATLEIGLAVIDIREAVLRHVMPGPWQEQQDLLLAAISGLFRNPSTQALEQALSAIDQVINETAASVDWAGGASGALTAGPARVRAQLHVIRLTLLDSAFPLVDSLAGAATHPV
jgi:hypothetical protein